MESLGINLSALPVNIFLNILNIVLLFVIVRTLAYKPIRKFMDARTARVNAEAEAAEKKAQDADKAKAEYEAMLSQGEVLQNEKMQEVTAEAKAQAAEILREAEEKASEILQGAQEKAKKVHEDALKDMQGEIVDLAFEISEKLLEHSVRDADTDKLASRLFEDHLNGEE